MPFASVAYAGRLARGIDACIGRRRISVGARLAAVSKFQRSRIRESLLNRYSTKLEPYLETTNVRDCSQPPVSNACDTCTDDNLGQGTALGLPIAKNATVNASQAVSLPRLRN